MSLGSDLFNQEIADYVWLAGVKIPTLCSLMADPVRTYAWDEQGGIGLAGAFPVFNGQKLAHFSLRFTMWDEESIDDFDVYADENGPEQLLTVKFVRSKDGKIRGAQPMTIKHPVINQLGINAVVVENRGPIKWNAGGLYTCDVSFIEYRPPPRINASKRSDGPVSGKKDIPPRDPQEVQIEQLTAQAQAAQAREAAKR